MRVSKYLWIEKIFVRRESKGKRFKTIESARVFSFLINTINLQSPNVKGIKYIQEEWVSYSLFS